MSLGDVPEVSLLGLSPILHFFLGRLPVVLVVLLDVCLDNVDVSVVLVVIVEKKVNALILVVIFQACTIS